MPPVWPFRIATNFPSEEFHTRAVLSKLVVTILLLSGENAQLLSQAVWPSSLVKSRPFTPSQTSTMSLLAVTASLPSGENAAYDAIAVLYSSLASSLPVAASHTRA